MDPVETFVADVERYLQAVEMPPTTFGKRAADDPTFVFDLRKGREPRWSTIKKVQKYMADNPPRRRAS